MLPKALFSARFTEFVSYLTLESPISSHFTREMVLQEFAEAQSGARVRRELPDYYNEAPSAYSAAVDAKLDRAFNGVAMPTKAEQKAAHARQVAEREAERRAEALRAVNEEQARILFDAYEDGQRAKRHAESHAKGAKCYVTGCKFA